MTGQAQQAKKKNFITSMDSLLSQNLVTPIRKKKIFPTMVGFSSLVLLLVLVALSASARKQSRRRKRSCREKIDFRDFFKAIDESRLPIAAGQDLETQVAALLQVQEEELKIGSTTEHIAEASDAAVTGAPVKDGKSGDIDFPHGNMKPIATVGEMSVCSESFGESVVGVPDGLGAYLVDEDTVRVIVASESCGPIKDYESYPFAVNDESAHITGSHVQYVDYNRKGLRNFMGRDKPASTFVKGFGEVIKTAYNLKGELLGPRNTSGPTTIGAHFSNCDADGNYVIAEPLFVKADWLFQSLCSAHLEEKFQWGNGIGLEDNTFIVNEEWIDLLEGEEGVGPEGFVGLSAHAIDLATGESWATGAFTNGGFEKIVEINSQHPDYVAFSIAGYNGSFKYINKIHEKRKAEFGARSDGKVYVWPKDIVPARVYIGKKGYAEDCSTPSGDFLGRNGLRCGQIYGYAVDMRSSGPTKGIWRDEFHKSAQNGARVQGKWLPINWHWEGEVTDFAFDGSWEFQNDPDYSDAGFKFWNAKGYDTAGCKTEHGSPDPRQGKSAFIQGSTCGYFGHYYLTNLPDMLDATIGQGKIFPEEISGEYYVYNGETDITNQIKLGGKGQYAEGKDAKINCSGKATEPKCVKTFEDIDGLEVLHAKDGKLYAILQEDSTNLYGDRMFITSPLEHENDGKNITYHFIAMSGGERNTRMKAGVGIPAGTNAKASGHEFSGIFDLSGLLSMKNNGDHFDLKASDAGYKKRAADADVGINDKNILIGLQAHNMHGGIIETFRGDRGGQWLVYKPSIFEDE